MPPLQLKLTRGLALFDCQDHHAILGIPINADAKVIRRRYLKIARKLHPDSVAAGVDKDMASTILSKLVNPSYEFLSSSSQLEEYNILLKLVAQRYSQDQNRYPLSSDQAKQLLQSNDVEKAYQELVTSVAEQQFDTLGQYSGITETLSEINLIYLYRQDGPAVKPSPAAQVANPRASQPVVPAKQPRAAASGAPQAPSAPARSTMGSMGVNSRSTMSGQEDSSRRINYDLVDQYCRRAEELISKACYLEAVRELKEVVEGNNPIDPNNSKVYTLLGDIYKEHMKQPVMAKPFYMKALKSDPDNAALQQKLSSLAPSTPKQSKATKSSPGKGKASDGGADKKKFGFLNFLSRKK